MKLYYIYQYVNLPKVYQKCGQRELNITSTRKTFGVINILDLMCYGLLGVMKGKFEKVVQFQYRKSPDDSFLKLRKLQQLSHEFYSVLVN